MKKQRHWLDFAEYASLVGLGVGSIASFVSSHVLYTSAPLSFLVLLNLANRRRLEQLTWKNTTTALNEMDRKLSKHVELLNQQVMALPTPEAMGSLKKSLLIKNREVLEKLSAEISSLQNDMLERFSLLERQNLGVIRQDITRMQEQYFQLCDSIAQVTAQLGQLSSSNRLEQVESAIAQLQTDAAQLRTQIQAINDQTKPSLNSLQDQINHLNRQIQKLPPPFDSTALRQEVAELVRVVAELVPKRDWHNLVSEIRALHQQQETRAQTEEILRRKIQELSLQIQAYPEKANITALQSQINHLNRQVQKLPPPFDPSSLKYEIAELMKAVANLVPKRDWSALLAQVQTLQQQQEFQQQVEQTLQEELQEINRHLQAIAVSQTPPSSQPVTSPSITAPDLSLTSLPPTPLTPSHEPETLQPQREFQARIEQILQRELKAIDQQLRELPSGPQLHSQIAETMRRELQDVNQQLRAFPSDAHYELIFDLQSRQLLDPTEPSASRVTLEEALDVTQERLILIWPWSNLCTLDDRLLQKLETFLSQGRQLDLGWCHQIRREEERFLSSINQRWSISHIQQDLQETLQKFLTLKRKYPDRLQFKILGTGENFLVSDRAFAVLGINEVLPTSTILPDFELKLWTDDGDVIQQSIDRFEKPVLETDDILAYWNQAVTHYDLGDRKGALADFERVLAATPEDALAFNYRGLVRYDLGDCDGALADFNRSLELNPKQVAPYCNRGYIRSEQGDQLGAIADLSLAIQNQPTSAIAYFYRGVACQKYNDPLAAASDFSEAIRLMPDVPISYYYRAQAYQKLENLRGAIADFEIAAKGFNARGNKTNAQKALKNLVRLKQLMTQRGLSIKEPVVATDPTADGEALAILLPHVDPPSATNGYSSDPSEEAAEQNGHSPTLASDFVVPPIPDAGLTLPSDNLPQPHVNRAQPNGELTAPTPDTTAHEPAVSVPEGNPFIDIPLVAQPTSEAIATSVAEESPQVVETTPADVEPAVTIPSTLPTESQPGQPTKAETTSVETLSNYFYGPASQQSLTESGSGMNGRSLGTFDSPSLRGDRLEDETLAEFSRRFISG